MQSVLKLFRDGGGCRLGGPASAIDEGTREAEASGQTVEGQRVAVLFARSEG